MSWFEETMGFEERDLAYVQSNIRIAGSEMISKVNGKSYRWGKLEVPNLGTLRARVSEFVDQGQPTTIQEFVGDVGDLHRNPANANAFFQVASQFNLLEMIGPSATPEQGVGRYEFDKTQGPACAIACGVGTIYRNYFVPLGDQYGQTANRQIDCLYDLGLKLGNEGGNLWRMQNGYALATRLGLQRISHSLSSSDLRTRKDLEATLRIGLQLNTQVTLHNSPSDQYVNQAYCSALPVAYSQHDSHLWKDFAKLILDASYEATFAAALRNKMQSGNNRLFLTLLGGGAFGNETDWIVSAIARSLSLYHNAGLEVYIVSYRYPNRQLAHLWSK